MSFLRISIHTSIERNNAVTKVREAIGECGGWIVSHSFFSNLMATINFEIPMNNAELFIVKLKEVDFNPDIESEIPEGGKGDLRGQVTLSFLHQDPDLKRDIPAFG